MRRAFVARVASETGPAVVEFVCSNCSSCPASPALSVLACFFLSCLSAAHRSPHHSAVSRCASSISEGLSHFGSDSSEECYTNKN